MPIFTVSIQKRQGYVHRLTVTAASLEEAGKQIVFPATHDREIVYKGDTKMVRVAAGDVTGIEIEESQTRERRERQPRTN